MGPPSFDLERELEELEIAEEDEYDVIDALDRGVSVDEDNKELSGR